MNQFKENLRINRLGKGITQRQLAKILGVSPNNIGHWEKGRTEPDIETLLKLAEVFDISVDELLKQSD